MTAAPLTARFAQVIPATAAAVDFVAIICKAPFAGTLTAASYVADTTLTGANTESRTLNVHNRGQAGSGTTVMATKAFTSGVNATQYDETSLTLTATAADLVVAEGDVITVQSLHVGSTGLADPGGTAILEFSRS